MHFPTATPQPRAVVAIRDDSVREFLTVHLQDRSFAVEPAHRIEYLRAVAPGSDLVIADLDTLVRSDFEIFGRPSEIIALGPEPTAADEHAAAELGAMALFRIPFENTEKLASMLDSIAARAVERLAEPIAEAALAAP